MGATPTLRRRLASRSCAWRSLPPSARERPGARCSLERRGGRHLLPPNRRLPARRASTATFRESRACAPPRVVAPAASRDAAALWAQPTLRLTALRPPRLACPPGLLPRLWRWEWARPKGSPPGGAGAGVSGGTRRLSGEPCAAEVPSSTCGRARGTRRSWRRVGALGVWRCGPPVPVGFLGPARQAGAPYAGSRWRKSETSPLPRHAASHGLKRTDAVRAVVEVNACPAQAAL